MAESNYRTNAALARSEAETATLDNVKERCLRAEAAWVAMAERQERVERARAHNNRSADRQTESENREIQPIEIE